MSVMVVGIFEHQSDAFGWLYTMATLSNHLLNGASNKFPGTCATDGQRDHCTLIIPPKFKLQQFTVSNPNNNTSRQYMKMANHIGEQCKNQRNHAKLFCGNSHTADELTDSYYKLCENPNIEKVCVDPRFTVGNDPLIYFTTCEYVKWVDAYGKIYVRFSYQEKCKKKDQCSERLGCPFWHSIEDILAFSTNVQPVDSTLNRALMEKIQSLEAENEKLHNEIMYQKQEAIFHEENGLYLLGKYEDLEAKCKELQDKNMELEHKCIELQDKNAKQEAELRNWIKYGKEYKALHLELHGRLRNLVDVFQPLDASAGQQDKSSGKLKGDEDDYTLPHKKQKLLPPPPQGETEKDHQN